MKCSCASDFFEQNIAWVCLIYDLMSMPEIKHIFPVSVDYI